MTKRKIDNMDLIKSLQRVPTKKNASYTLDALAQAGDYALIIDNNVDSKVRTLHMIALWLDGENSDDKDYYIKLINIVRNSPYNWFDQSTLQPVSASDVISMLK